MENGLLPEDAIWLPYQRQPLSTDHSIHLFKIKVDTHYKKIKFDNILSKSEQEKANRFLQQIDRESYIISKYFLRVLLSQFLQLSAAEIEYSYTGNHKPALRGIQFNMSHSKNYVVIAISEYPVGIDIEHINPDFNFKEMIPMCFNQQESSFVLRNEQLSDFYLLWTRKEALLKATGEGLVDHLDQVPSLLNEAFRKEQLFKISSIKINDDYLMSLAFSPQPNITVTLWDC